MLLLLLLRSLLFRRFDFACHRLDPWHQSSFFASCCFACYFALWQFARHNFDNLNIVVVYLLVALLYPCARRAASSICTACTRATTESRASRTKRCIFYWILRRGYGRCRAFSFRRGVTGGCNRSSRKYQDQEGSLCIAVYFLSHLCKLIRMMPLLQGRKERAWLRSRVCIEWMSWIVLMSMF